MTAPNDLSRTLTLARAETTLLLRNKTATSIAVLTPPLIVPLVSLMPAGAGLPALVMAMLTGTALLFVVYYTLVTSAVARREEHYLKRLYTSTARPVTILLAMVLPLLVLLAVQLLLGFAAVAALLDYRPSWDALLVLVAALLGAAAWWALALASTVFTRTVESAQLTTLPLLMVALLFSGLSLPLALLPDPAVLLAQLTPMFPVVDLVYLGVAGIRITGDTVAGSELLRTVLLDAAVLVGWTVAGLFLVRRRFRWEPRR
ncbi:putative ABC transporter permease protein [Microlunatus phosphovorus NM-1]|uniref:Putative ABC transporter permease protein n=1 Tax=Microlunatus phosphovorus (strain ATCC 700054 / DSM 10555 / JCM 9379 / NBRC 101784 / NCIMB 13414 / VKM Ac-1990 / NM-1) TaxID=1032480 RepID=F5XRB8_MICPN|nr:ABC transporter permease [Microlunatus phosphovorus]BAK34608.1 putative ABC transporter permease protein [Microlunatus phosphovorus NM-1]